MCAWPHSAIDLCSIYFNRFTNMGKNYAAEGLYSYSKSYYIKTHSKARGLKKVPLRIVNIMFLALFGYSFKLGLTYNNIVYHTGLATNVDLQFIYEYIIIITK